MENLSFGQILILILFILVPLINFLMQAARRRLEDQAARDRTVTQMRRQAQATPAPAPTARGSRNPPREAQEPTVATPLFRRRLAQRALVKNRRDARRGIIAMTILGPCRTFDPLD